MWNIWRDVKLLLLDFFLMICFFSCFMFLTTRVTFSRGTIHVLCAMVQRSGYSTCGYHGWSPWRTCNSFSVMGRGSTQEPPCRQLAICNFRCAVVAICRGRSRFSSDGTVTSNKDVEWLPSHGFSLLIIQPLLSGLIEVFFARTMRSTSEFAKIFLSKCVCVFMYGIYPPWMEDVIALRCSPRHLRPETARYAKCRGAAARPRGASAGLGVVLAGGVGDGDICWNPPFNVSKYG